MLWSFVYFAFGRVIELVMLCLPRRDSKEIEILVLRHELEIIRRQHRRARLKPSDRAWLALWSRKLPVGCQKSVTARDQAVRGD